MRSGSVNFHHFVLGTHFLPLLLISVHTMQWSSAVSVCDTGAVVHFSQVYGDVPARRFSGSRFVSAICIWFEAKFSCRMPFLPQPVPFIRA